MGDSQPHGANNHICAKALFERRHFVAGGFRISCPQ
jgi:hypothetical protein